MALAFYILVLFCLLIEVNVIGNTERAVRASITIKEKSGDGTLDTLAGFDRNYALQHSLYTIVAIVGLFSSQWPLFALLLVMGIIGTQFPKNITYRKVDSAISVAILLFIILNKFHLHLHLI